MENIQRMKTRAMQAITIDDTKMIVQNVHHVCVLNESSSHHFDTRPAGPPTAFDTQSQ